MKAIKQDGSEDLLIVPIWVKVMVVTSSYFKKVWLQQASLNLSVFSQSQSSREINEQNHIVISGKKFGIVLELTFLGQSAFSFLCQFC